MKKLALLALILVACLNGMGQKKGTAPADVVTRAFLHPSAAAKPRVLWYWMQGAVTREGITADLEAMKQEGIGAAYLVCIKPPANPPYINPLVVQLTPEWWGMVKFAVQEAGRLGLELGIHDSDGFALAGGPWITPQLSMQKVVSSQTRVKGGTTFTDTLITPAHYKDYYHDIKILAYPALPGSGVTSYKQVPKVTTSVKDIDPQFLVEKGNKKTFSSSDPCWIQLGFKEPFTCRSLQIRSAAPNYQAERLTIEVSDDGKAFRTLTQLKAPRHGWQDGDAPVTNVIPTTTARFYRLVYDKEGSEPGAEDLDFAKWKQSLKINAIELSSEPRIHQYEGKTGEVWRVSERSTALQLPDELCIPKDKIIDLTDKLDKAGRLNWNVPAGDWVVVRIGHTSTGHTNATGGGGIGLECDKFNPAAAELQFNKWFGEALRQCGPELARKVIKNFYIDSWECGSQNWSDNFAAEFKARRGYDLMAYLPVMVGLPVESATVSEKVLSDVRETIAELVRDKFYGTLAKLAHQNGCQFNAESVAPTMTSDGLLHYSMVDVPMGEFWLRSPTHDKPNDMLDAISGGHIYGKNIIQAEGFTELRTVWDEHPAMLKALADRNLAAGMNRLTFHVNVLNPWLDRKPGMTLDGIGLYFQRDQTWYKPAKAWVEYLTRCQALLQLGHPVTDLAVFTGEETPRRSILPYRLVNTLPGIFGQERVATEQVRLANKGLPLRTIPDGVTSSANMADPEKWIDPLRGYQYDSFNKDALLRLAQVKDGKMILPGGAAYNILIVPGDIPMNPQAGNISPEVAKKLTALAKQGLKIVLATALEKAPGMSDDATVAQAGKELAAYQNVLKGAYQQETFESVGLARDFSATDSAGHPVNDLAWAHRQGEGFDLYFISNQQDAGRTVSISLRVGNRVPEIFDPLTGTIQQAKQYRTSSKQTSLTLKFDPSQALFVVLRKPALGKASNKGDNWNHFTPIQTLEQKWQVQFDAKMRGPKSPVVFNGLSDWSKSMNDSVKYYSGTAVYRQQFNFKNSGSGKTYIDLGKVTNLATVIVNGVDCGNAWTPPYRVDITKALKPGMNQLEIQVTNTWANRIMGDHNQPEEKRLTWTNAPYRLENKALLPAGLLGPVRLLKTDN
ncbi:DNA-binding protein [Mucilaginibacter sp. RS28]|uniref:DNA-binding protein n=1 Tax=Mucilaginibacter straminoryzae TaxID=2932774 RepID=A0A9X2BBM5_9SPHI|nr:glycosyl hydrolase [Mucilaginibacter straminoryzae]MCJ8210002.1 DNA-binding protein [Mucilaginibacter straminoryzae]